MINEPLWGITRQGYGTGFQARTLNEAQSLISTLSTDKRNPQKALRCRQSSRLMIRALLLLVWCASSSAFIVYGQTTTRAVTQDKATSPSDARLSKLPPALRERGLALLNESGEKERARLADDLAKEKADSVMDFLLSVLKLEPSATVRSAIIDRLGRHSHPQIQQALEHHAASDADATVSILALEKLRLQQTQEMEQILTRRLEMARRSGDQRSLRQLAQEHERWISLIRGTMLPAFMRVVPPQFSLKAIDQPVRVLAFGDFGNGSNEQKQVAAAMLRYQQKTPFDFAITLGDNFYGKGMESPADPRWKSWWAELYDPLGIKFYATLGNHDWGLADSPAAEILYSERSPSWRMPAPYYTFTAGPVQFFALDTNDVSEAQLIWLNDELEKSRAAWKLVYGHHPIYSAGAHGDSERLIKKLLPVLKNRAEMYLAGHDHDLQHLKPDDGVQFFISGGGGARIRPIKPVARSLFAKSAYGFTVLEADAKQLKVTFIGIDGSQLYTYTLNKGRES